MNTSRSALEWLIDARDYARQAHRIGHGDGGRDWDTQDYLAARYCLVVIGEALNWVPEQVLADEAATPWRKVIALRHRLVHGYWLIDEGIIFEIAQNETDPLIAALDRLIENNR
jgi:uncharacterized protein with HEPN domain